jgi:class 3 adenylate cyclase
MFDPVDRIVRAIARRNSYALVWAQFGVGHLVALAGVGLLRLYKPMSDSDFWLLVAVSQAAITIDNLIGIKMTLRMWRPVRAWERGARDEASTIAAWTALATLPQEYLWRRRKYPVLFFYLPITAFATWKLDLQWYWWPALSVIGSAVLAAGVLFRYFAMEVVVRPVLEQVAEGLPPDFKIEVPGLPLRARLLATAPVINVLTGMVVAGIALHGHGAHLRDLGIAWLIAVAVSLTVSLELAVLVFRSVGSAFRDLQQATQRVATGDFTARVPVVATDETGALAQSFNRMVEGLGERERLREAFGAYVDPGLAERVLTDGADFAGEELTVTVLFLDIRNFTAFAEQSSPHEVVTLLNDFWELVVPVLRKHGGHPNKFIGDGLLAVFGAPERFPDHAERAVAAAVELAGRIRTAYGGRISVGIGVNSGNVIAGTVGGGGRVEFTVIGDTVNTASRVERATRETGDDVLITEATRGRLSADRFELEERPPVPLKGKREEVRLWVPRIREPAAKSAARAGASVTK